MRIGGMTRASPIAKTIKSFIYLRAFVEGCTPNSLGPTMKNLPTFPIKPRMTRRPTAPFGELLVDEESDRLQHSEPGSLDRIH